MNNPNRVVYTLSIVQRNIYIY